MIVYLLIWTFKSDSIAKILGANIYEDKHAFRVACYYGHRFEINLEFIDYPYMPQIKILQNLYQLNEK